MMPTYTTPTSITEVLHLVTDAVVDLEGFLWFLQKPLLKPEETLQDIVFKAS